MTDGGTPRRSTVTRARNAAKGSERGAAPAGKLVVRVAIVGGGCAGVSAAWHLSALNQVKDHPVHYRITVYERNAHLGGKGASTRDARGRILEHGLHIWLGFYENAFKMMRDCYAVVQNSPHIGRPGLPLFHCSFDEAFFPEAQIGLAAKSAQGTWEAWTGYFPPMPGLPGDGVDSGGGRFTLTGYLRRALGLVKMLAQSVLASPGDRERRRSDLDEALDTTSSFDPRETPTVLVERMSKLLHVGVLATAAGWLQGVTILESVLRQETALPLANLRVLKFVEALAAQARRQLSAFVSIDPALRRKTEIIDLVMTIMVGLVRDKVMIDPRGLDAIDHVDCRAWLEKHGATHSSLDSPFVKGLYDLAFAYRDGDKTQMALAAGQALRGALRMFFSYRGAMFWRMRSGMGETVFAPLYRVLRDRGVDFRFLHKVDSVGFSPQGKDGPRRITDLRFTATGDNPDGLAAEDPLDRTGCWPLDYKKHFSKKALGSGSKKVRLRDGKQFEAVVMANGVDGFTAACSSFCNEEPRWNRMREQVKTVGTQAAQFWMQHDLHTLGWRRGSVVLSGYCEPFDTWADMTHTIAAERKWRQSHEVQSPDDSVRSIAYFCSVIPDSEAQPAAGAAPRTSDRTVRANAKTFLAKAAAGLWPNASDLARKTGLLVDADGVAVKGLTAASLSSQYYRANVHGSERYTLALPGSLEHRISPLDYSVANMTIAGDWTHCGFNEGCIEAAVMSGMLAAHAISGKPDLEDIVGYHHP